MNNKIAYVKPSITSLEHSFVDDAIKNGWGEQCYEYINQFEAMFGEFIGAKYVHATSSCTGALTLGLAALGIGPGDEVIVADANWIATVAPITKLGAKPIFVDIDATTWCIDVDDVKEKITSKSKAIICTHLYGNVCDLDELVELAETKNLFLIEDAAEAIGSYYKGKHVGTFSDFSVFSFHGSKTITCGEGGIIVCKDQELHEKVLMLNNHGRAKNETRQFWPDEIGYKFKMSNIQAAVGCAQLKRVNELIERKREVLNNYKLGLSEFSEILKLNQNKESCETGAWMTNVEFKTGIGINRELLVSEFSSENIDARVFFWPLSALPVFGSNQPRPISNRVASHSINLPSFHDITKTEQNRVIETLKNVIRKYHE